MANNVRRRRARHRQEGLFTGWMMMLFGIGLGLFMAGLIYLSLFPDRDDKSARDKQSKTATAETGDAEISLPHFEFYSILPELEVVIPERFADSLREVLEQTGAVDEQAKTKQDSKPETTERHAGTYFIQAGSFKVYEDAERMRIKLLLLGLDVNLQAVKVEGDQYHRVRIGPLTDFDSFDLARQRLKENNIQFMVLRSRNQ